MLNYFNLFKDSAFRLELLQEYNVEEEKKPFLEFKKTGKIERDIEWENIVKEAKNRGAKISRVHIIEYPLSNYLKFEIEAYKFNQEVGEEIFLINKKELNNLNLNNLSDFWIFDNKIVLKMNYSKDGKFLNFDFLDKNINHYIQVKNLLLNKINYNKNKKDLFNIYLEK